MVDNDEKIYIRGVIGWRGAIHIFSDSDYFFFFFVTSSGENSPIVDGSKIYSESEIARSDQEMKNILEQARTANEGKSFADVFSEARTEVLFLSWLPWFVFPLLLKRQARSAYFLMGVLFLHVVGWLAFLTTTELVVSVVSVCAGLVVSIVLKREPKAPNAGLHGLS